MDDAVRPAGSDVFGSSEASPSTDAALEEPLGTG